MMNQKINSMDEQLELLSEEIRREEGVQSVGRVVGVLGLRTVPGSYKGGDLKVEFVGGVVCTGNILERIEITRSVLKDIPLAHWKTVMAAIYDMQKERMEYEMANEPNGISLPLEGAEKEITTEEATDNTSLTGKIRKMFTGEDHREGGNG